MVNANLSAYRTGRRRHACPHRRTLEGVRHDNRRTLPDAVGGLGEALAAQGQIADWLVSPDGPFHSGRAHDQRADAREHMRLRSAKVLDGAFQFVCECRVCDRSPHGLRLALARDVPLPRRLAVHIDASAEVRCAKVVWRRGLIGVRLYDHASKLKPSDRFALRERDYGILD